MMCAADAKLTGGEACEATHLRSLGSMINGERQRTSSRRSPLIEMVFDAECALISEVRAEVVALRASCIA